jgi:DNA-directed RNA polymerase specialized sigma24 family protein
MKRCQTCLLWNKGKGSKTCVDCSFYRRFCMKSTPRSKIPIDIVPDAIMAELADTSEEMPAVLTALKHLPDDLSWILVGRFVAGIKPSSMAAIMRTSERQINRRQAVALSELKKMLRKEIIDFQKKHVI